MIRKDVLLIIENSLNIFENNEIEVTEIKMNPETFKRLAGVGYIGSQTMTVFGIPLIITEETKGIEFVTEV